MKCIDYLVSGEKQECPNGPLCPFKRHGGHTPFESSSREIPSRPFTKLEADFYRKIQPSNSWPEGVFPTGYWRSNGFRDQWVNDEPNLYLLSGIGGTRWPEVSWKRKAVMTPEKYKVAPLIFD